MLTDSQTELVEAVLVDVVERLAQRECVVHQRTQVLAFVLSALGIISFT